MAWDEKPEDCPKAFNIHNPVCEGCSQKTECLQAALGDKMDAYIKISEKSLEVAEKWEKDQKEKIAAGPYVTGMAKIPKKRDRKELLNEFLTDFCDFTSLLNNCLAAAGITIEVQDQITLFMQWQNYCWQHKYDTEENRP